MTLSKKISVLVIAFLLLFTGTFLVIVYHKINKDLKENIIESFSEQQRTISHAQNLIYDRLVESSLLISQNPAFKANVLLNDESSVQQIVIEFLDLLKVDLIVVTNSDGDVVSSFPEQMSNEETWTRKSINAALLGEIPDVAFEKPEIWKLNDEIFQIVSVPIFTDTEIIGSLTLGTLISDYEAKSLQLSEDVDVHFTYDNILYASSLEEPLITDEIMNEVDHITNNGNPRFIENNTHFFTFSALDESGKTFLISTSEKSKALAILNNLLNGLLVLSLGALIFLFIGGGYLGKMISAPIMSVINAFQQLEKGDFTVTLKESERNEFGRLGKAFNQMVNGLKERSQLISYVGNQTLGKVANNSQESEKIEATVMFSDIRGFTAYAEQRSPGEVVGILNKWLGFQTELILEHGGSIDKFVGDEVMAIFRGEDSLENCLQCAIAIQSKSIQEHQNEELGLGIGIHHGEMILGDIGTDQRKDFTVIGAVVNLASRLCGKALKNQILILSEILSKDLIKSAQEIEMSLKGISNVQRISIIEHHKID